MKGKPLDWPPKSENEQPAEENTKRAIVLLRALDMLFVKNRETVTKKVTRDGITIPYSKEVSRTYYAEREYSQMFENRFREEKICTPIINQKEFVKYEKSIFEDLLKQIENTGADEKHIYRHEAYIRGTQYLNFLKEDANKPNLTFVNLHNELKPYLGITLESLESLITTRRAKEKGQWIAKGRGGAYDKADAYKFALWLNKGQIKDENGKSEIWNFNQNIAIPDGSKLTGDHRKKSAKGAGTIYNILKQYSIETDPETNKCSLQKRQKP